MLAKMKSRRHFQHGDAMPDLKSGTWVTIWQRDEQQT